MDMDKVPSAMIRELCGMTNRVDERNDKGVLRWFGLVKRMENNEIAKRMYVGECAGSLSIDRPTATWYRMDRKPRDTPQQINQSIGRPRKTTTTTKKNYIKGKQEEW